MNNGGHDNRGFTLVEVLVAVMILSIGLLAVAGMQLTSMRSGNSAHYRTQAALGCEDILDRMRANAAAARAGDYDITFAQAPGASATHVLMVLTDLNDWRATLAANLPAGTGAIAIDPVNSDLITVTVRWTDSFGQDTVVMGTRL